VTDAQPDRAEAVSGTEASGSERRARGLGPSQPLRILAAVALLALWAAELLITATAAQRALGLVLLAVLARITVSDLEQRRIPNRVTLPAGVLALLIGLLLRPAGVPAQLLAGLLTGTFLTVFALITRGGLGMGDAKLGLVMGLYLGHYVLLAMVVGLLASAIFSLGVLARRGLRAGARTAIPLGPFLALGGAFAVLAGPALAAHVPGT
jgi:prepilin signal peptidase PulO-like enzyme (type II secretory pathway)